MAADLVNVLAIDHAFGRPAPRADPVPALRTIFARDATWPKLHPSDVRGLVALATDLRETFVAAPRGHVDVVAQRLNRLLAAHPAYPHLAKDGGVWRLHHHSADAALVPMTAAICAEALARIVGAQGAHRLGTCEAPACERAYLDESKNASRRYCSTTCQNRVKATAFRRNATARPAHTAANRNGELHGEHRACPQGRPRGSA